ncbi:hypothetical protein HDU76_005731, partial [Blyttiomyces sp. JEL0837]
MYTISAVNAVDYLTLPGQITTSVAATGSAGSPNLYNTTIELINNNVITDPLNSGIKTMSLTILTEYQLFRLEDNANNLHLTCTTSTTNFQIQIAPAQNTSNEAITKLTDTLNQLVAATQGQPKQVRALLLFDKDSFHNSALFTGPCNSLVPESMFGKDKTILIPVESASGSPFNVGGISTNFRPDINPFDYVKRFIVRASSRGNPSVNASNANCGAQVQLPSINLDCKGNVSDVGCITVEDSSHLHFTTSAKGNFDFEAGIKNSVTSSPFTLLSQHLPGAFDLRFVTFGPFLKLDTFVDASTNLALTYKGGFDAEMTPFELNYRPNKATTIDGKPTLAMNPHNFTRAPGPDNLTFDIGIHLVPKLEVHLDINFANFLRFNTTASLDFDMRAGYHFPLSQTFPNNTICEVQSLVNTSADLNAVFNLEFPPIFNWTVKAHWEKNLFRIPRENATCVASDPVSGSLGSPGAASITPGSPGASSNTAGSSGVVTDTAVSSSTGSGNAVSSSATSGVAVSSNAASGTAVLSRTASATTAASSSAVDRIGPNWCWLIE